MSAEFQDRDNGYKKLVETVFGLGSPVVTMGIHENAGATSLTNGKTLIDVAKINEFGSSDGHVPMRSFVRAWFDGAEPELRSKLVELMQEVIAGKKTKVQILNEIGRQGVAGMQARIDAQIPPPNAPSTIRKKGSSTPLIATGLMRNSITHKVDLGQGLVESTLPATETPEFLPTNSE